MKMHLRKILVSIFIFLSVSACIPIINSWAKNSKYISVKVSNKKELSAALKNEKANIIIFETNSDSTITISDKYNTSKTKLIIDAPNSIIKNKGSFKNITINNALKYNEYSSENTIDIYDNDLVFKVTNNAKAKRINLKSDGTIKLINNGSLGRLYIESESTITISGNSKDKLNITVKKSGDNITLKSTLPVKINSYGDFDITLETGSENSIIIQKNNTSKVSVNNNTEKAITIQNVDGIQNYIKSNKNTSSEKVEDNNTDLTKTKETDADKDNLKNNIDNYPGYNSETNTENSSENESGSLTPNIPTPVLPQVTNIAITTQPLKTTYFEGDIFDSTGMLVTAYYNNETQQQITEYIIDKTSELTVDDTTITISYEGKTDFVTITVEPVVVSEIHVTNLPAKTSYFVGDTFDTTGMIVTANYNNGTQQQITEYSIDKSSTLTVEDTTITVTYEGKTDSVTITVEPVVVSEIHVTNLPAKTSYFVGDTFDTIGLIVTAYYNNGTQQQITEYSIDKSSTLTLEDTTITVTYEGKTDSVTITVEPVVVTEIHVTNPPSKTSYFVGDTFDTTGLIVTAYYNNETQQEITEYSIDKSSTLTVEDTTITVTYEGKTDSVTITVEPVVVTEIQVTTPPSKTNYIVGETFDVTSMVITAYYNNGSEYTITDYAIDKTGALSLEDTIKTISYNEKSTTVSISVEPVLQHIEITTFPTKTRYLEGEEFDSTGMVVTAYYDNETQQEISNYTIDTTNALTLSNTTITIIYKGKTTYLPIEVREAWDTNPMTKEELMEIGFHENNFSNHDDETIHFDYYVWGQIRTEKLTLPTSIDNKRVLLGNRLLVDSVVHELTVPGVFTTIPEGFLLGPTGVKKVIFEHGVETIGSLSFSMNPSLIEVYIPVTVKMFQGLCFGTHDANNSVMCIEHIYYEGSIAQWNEIIKADNWDNKNQNNYTIHCSDGNIDRYGNLLNN